MNNKEKAEEIGKINARQYHHNTFEGGLKNSEYVFSDKECQQSALDMAEWKDKQFRMYLEKVREVIRNSKNPQIEPLINAMIEWIEK